MYGLIGRRLGHSYSEPIHRALTNGAYDYRLIEVEPDALADFLRSREFDGLNVTIPYKRAVIPFLDELTPDAERIGAVNTIFRRGDRWIGDNTDAVGLRYALARIGLDPDGKRCVISGNGGTARTATVVLNELGAASVRLVSRREGIPFERAGTLLDTELIVNATPLGMSPETDGDPFDLTLFPKLTGVFDAIYNPLSTRFLQRAQRLGLIQGCGLRMLVAQAKAAAERFLGDRLDDGAIERVYRELRAGTENVPYIVAIAEAYRLLKETYPERVRAETGLRERLIGRVLDEVPDVRLTGDPESRLSNHASFSFKGIDSLMLQSALDQEGYAVSIGSACRSNQVRGQQQLVEIGLPSDWLNGGLRITNGLYSTPESVDGLVDALKETVSKIRSFLS